MEPKRRGPWKIFLAIPAAFTLAGAVGGYLHLRAGASIEAHRADIDAILHGIPVRTDVRPVVLGSLEPGNVWDLLRPAFDSLWDMHEDRYGGEGISIYAEPDFTAHGTPGPTAQLLTEAAPALEACRHSTRRSRLEWVGPVDEQLPHKALRAARALCSNGVLAWQQQQDAEAAEWFLTSLSVAYDSARLGQDSTWPMLLVAEEWVLEDLQSFLAEQALTADQLADFERRLSLLVATRPSLFLDYQVMGAIVRRDFLEVRGGAEFSPPQGVTTGECAPVGWRDLYSTRFFLARVMTGVRAGSLEAGRMTWTAGTDVSAQMALLRSHYRSEDVAVLLPQTSVAPQIRLELLRIAIGCARFQAATGRLPRTLAEAGLPAVIGALSIRLDEESLSLRVPGDRDDRTWTIGRRQAPSVKH